MTAMDINDRLNETVQFFEQGHSISDEIRSYRNECIEKASNSLDFSEKLLAVLAEEGKRKCKEMFEEVFSRDEETQKLILGDLYVYNENEMDSLLEFMMCREHPYYSEEAYKDFMEEFANTFRLKIEE